MLWSATIMNARIVVAVVGAVTLLLGLGGLFRPEWVMNFVGYAVASNAPKTLVQGEVRAVYGGMLIVAAVFTLLSVPDPREHQGRLLLLGLLWIGAGAGRMFGVFADGNPGIFGWLSLALELGGGAALIVASQTAGRTSVSTASTGSHAPSSTG
jgi:uncharacterized protein DUF4345